MSSMDYESVRAYVKLMEVIRERLTGDAPLSLDDALALPFPLGLHVLAADEQKRRVGNTREGLTLEKDFFEGHEKRRAEAAAAEAAVLQAKQTTKDQAAARKAEAADRRAAKLAEREEKQAAAGAGAAGYEAKAKQAVKWAQQFAAGIPADGVFVPGRRRDKLAILSLGTLQAETMFRLSDRLIPTGFISQREASDWRVDELVRDRDAKCQYLQEVTASSEQSPEFCVWPQWAGLTREAATEKASSSVLVDSSADSVWRKAEALVNLAKAEAAKRVSAAADDQQPEPAAAATPLPAGAGSTEVDRDQPTAEGGTGTGGGTAARGSARAARSNVRKGTGFSYFGLDVPCVQALLEMQPGLGECVTGDGEYVPLLQRFNAVAATALGATAPASEQIE